jgi:acylphosphatase
MKLKIEIAGPKVHGVGYRYFLLKHALLIGLRGFHAENRLDNGNQVVNILVEGDVERINKFAKLVERSIPEHADLSNVSIEEYDGEVPRAGEYAQLCTVVQVDKALPAILDIRDGIRALLESQKELVAGQKDLAAGQKDIAASQKELVEGQKELVEGQKELVASQKELVASQKELVAGQKELVAGQKELVAGMKDLAAGQKDLAADLKAGQKELVDGQKLMIEEIRGLREDLQPGLAMQIRALQVDIKAIKERLGMP